MRDLDEYTCLKIPVPTMVACRCVTSLLLTVLSILHTVSTTVAPLGTVRLRGSTMPYKGRVEVSNGTHWGTVCDDFWTIEEGHVVCRQLNYAGAIWMYRGVEVIRNSGWLTPMDIVADDLGCAGYESHLFNCPRNPGKHNCNRNTEAGGVECIDSTDIRLRTINGEQSSYGFIQVEVNGQWGTVCYDGWNYQSATVACRQLGKEPHDTWNPNLDAYYDHRLSNFPFILGNIECTGREDKLILCDHNRNSYRHFWNSNCWSGRAAAVACKP